jgi:hypothetical protein
MADLFARAAYSSVVRRYRLSSSSLFLIIIPSFNNESFVYFFWDSGIGDATLYLPSSAIVIRVYHVIRFMAVPPRPHWNDYLNSTESSHIASLSVVLII